MDDFVFGSMARDEQRLLHIRNQRGGVTHAQRRTPRDPLPGQPVSLHMTVGPHQLHPRAWVYWTNDGSDPQGAAGQAINGYAVELDQVGVTWDTLLWGYIRSFSGEIPGQQPGVIVRYRLAAGGAGEEVIADQGAYYAYYVDNDPPPAWSKDAIIYQIFADRFFAPDPTFPQVEPKPSLMCNGTLRGITLKLDYLAGLGINCLWITPIFPSLTYHGYDASDLFEINPRLGSKADFRELLDLAHARGIRVLLDFVPNHWSSSHASFVEAQANPESPFIEWYTFRHWPDDYKTFFGVPNLPQVNLRNPSAREHLLDALRYWLEFGVDGYRVDYCIGPTPDFFADFRRATRSTRADCWTFGEAIDPPDSQITFEGAMDGTLDFVLLEAFRAAFATETWTAQQFDDFLTRHEAFFPESFSRPSFLDNHDMNRFLWVAGGDQRRLRLAALCQFTLAGAPIIYYGSEVGLSQERDMRQKGRAIHEEARLPMPWGAGQDLELFAYYQNLCALRSSHPALRHGARATLHAGENLLVYRRVHEQDGLVTILNTAGQPAQIFLPIPETTQLLSANPGASVEIRAEGVQVTLPAYGGLVLA